MQISSIRCDRLYRWQREDGKAGERGDDRQLAVELPLQLQGIGHNDKESNLITRPFAYGACIVSKRPSHSLGFQSIHP